ncbi:hypothetical protein V8B97DRAFT_1921083 [Scleroderma yunnanense]
MSVHEKSPNWLDDYIDRSMGASLPDLCLISRPTSGKCAAAKDKVGSIPPTLHLGRQGSTDKGKEEAGFPSSRETNSRPSHGVKQVHFHRGRMYGKHSFLGSKQKKLPSYDNTFAGDHEQSLIAEQTVPGEWLRVSYNLITISRSQTLKWLKSVNPASEKTSLNTSKSHRYRPRISLGSLSVLGFILQRALGIDEVYVRSKADNVDLDADLLAPLFFNGIEVSFRVLIDGGLAWHG